MRRRGGGGLSAASSQPAPRVRLQICDDLKQTAGPSLMSDGRLRHLTHMDKYRKPLSASAAADLCRLCMLLDASCRLLHPVWEQTIA